MKWNIYLNYLMIENKTRISWKITQVLSGFVSSSNSKWCIKQFATLFILISVNHQRIKLKNPP